MQIFCEKNLVNWLNCPFFGVRFGWIFWILWKGEVQEVHPKPKCWWVIWEFVGFISWLATRTELHPLNHCHLVPSVGRVRFDVAHVLASAQWRVGRVQQPKYTERVNKLDKNWLRLWPSPFLEGIFGGTVYLQMFDQCTEGPWRWNNEDCYTWWT